MFFDGKEGEGNNYLVAYTYLYAHIPIARTFLQSKDTGFFYEDNVRNGVLKICNFSLFLMLIYLVSETSFNPLIAGGPPLVTDDTATLGPNKWEINLPYTRNNTKLEDTTEFPIDANYGLGERTDLNLIIPYTHINRDEKSNVNHLGDIQFNTKYRFIDESDWFFSVSTTPAIFLPTGNHRSKPDYFLPLKLTVILNLFI